MENFYVVYDATNPDVNRIGLSSGLVAHLKPEPISHEQEDTGGFQMWWILVAGGIGLTLIILVAAYVFCTRYLKREKE